MKVPVLVAEAVETETADAHIVETSNVEIKINTELQTADTHSEQRATDQTESVQGGLVPTAAVTTENPPRPRTPNLSPYVASPFISRPGNILTAPTATVPVLEGHSYFEVRASPKGGLGAFALENIPPHTTILTEPFLLQARSATILDVFAQLPAKEKQTFQGLATFKMLHPNKIVATFKVNR